MLNCRGVREWSKAAPRTTMAPLRTILEQGLVRHVGVSNHSLGRWRAAERGLGHAVLTNQIRFSLATPLPHWELVPYRGMRSES
jgi:diketogulonate reductase-like aldo/keto reductase